MGKTYHTKNAFKREIERISERRKEIARRQGVAYSDVALSSLNLYYQGLRRVRADMVRHPGGSGAKGLRRDYSGKGMVSDSRDRFGLAEEQSSRLRKERRAAVHAARARFKKDLERILSDLESE